MTEHEVGTREEHVAARKKLLDREKELTRLNDEISRQRREELPWVRIEKEYRFETDQGTKTLAELFDGRSQLLVYHFMFGPEYTAGCPACSAAADTFNGAVPHLNARGVTFVCDSRAPLEKLNEYKDRMGWSFPWVSSLDTDFRFDFGVSVTKEQQQEGAEYNYQWVVLGPVLEAAEGTPLEKLGEMTGTDAAGYTTEAPGLSAFALDDGDVYHTYSTYARGGEFMLGFYPFLDRAPRGRDEGDPPELWLRRHDEYEDTREKTKEATR
jgi:predicted dithiol-disulfide oxidoreductase (DUF899 family)